MSKSMFDPSLMAKSMSSKEEDFSEKNVMHAYVNASASVGGDDYNDEPITDWDAISRAFKHRKHLEEWLNGEVCAKHFGRKRR